MKTLRDTEVILDLYSGENEPQPTINLLFPEELCWAIWRVAKKDQFDEKIDTLKKIFLPAYETDTFNDFSVIRAISNHDRQMLIGNTIRLNSRMTAHYVEYDMRGELQKSLTYWYKGVVLHNEQWNANYKIIKCCGEAAVYFFKK